MLFLSAKCDTKKAGSISVASSNNCDDKLVTILGLSIIKKSKINEWNARLLSLNEQIEYWINPINISDKTIETVELFYDINKPED